MNDEQRADVALIRRVLGYVITEDGSTEAARAALVRLVARVEGDEATTTTKGKEA